jgi:hypothetical protein
LLVHGHSFGGLTVSSTEIDTLDAKMRNLDADVRVHQGPPMFQPGVVTPNPDFLAWHTFRNGEWLVLMTSWGQWNSAHQTMLSQTGDAVAGEFAGWVGKYNEARRRFISLGGKTEAEPVSPGSSAIGEALAALPWGKIALSAGAVVGVYWLVALGGAALLKKQLEPRPRRAAANRRRGERRTAMSNTHPFYSIIVQRSGSSSYVCPWEWIVYDAEYGTQVPGGRGFHVSREGAYSDARRWISARSAKPYGYPPPRHGEW